MSKVTIEHHRCLLRLRWQYSGKRHTLSLDVTDDAIGLGMAKMKASEIERDIAAGYFDTTLLKYKPRTRGKNATEITAPNLFKSFTQAMSKEKDLTLGALCKYEAALSHLEKFLNIQANLVSIEKANNFKALLLEQVSSSTAKSYLWLIQSCWTWAKGKYHIADSNPWAGLAAKIKPSPKQKVKPFSEKDVRAILEIFERHKYYSHYFPMVAFLFGVACRFGEAAALRWKHLSDDFTVVWIGESISRGNLRKKTKTGRAREVVLSPGLVSMLQSLYEQRQTDPNDLIFPAPRGGSMHDRNFRRVWLKVLKMMAIEYRKPYSTRHTGVTHALLNGVNFLNVAHQAGNNPKVLFENYAGVIESKSIFCDWLENI